MPRPHPLTNISSAIPNSQDSQLTPRTPHNNGSKTSRAEQGFAKLQLAEADDDEFDDLTDTTLQSAPLLASSSTARFSTRNGRQRETNPKMSHTNRGMHSNPTKALALAVSRVPLAIGVLLAVILLILIILSITRPDALHRYVGAKAPPPSASLTAPPQSPPHTTHKEPLHRISYANYSTFPLQGHEYRKECSKLHQGFMAHGDYWDISPMGAMDVLHQDDDSYMGTGKTSICSSTIIYMLDGAVGLTADLALMAQAAALARERNRTFLVDDTYWDRGKWTDHFQDVRALQPGPEPGCTAPPANEWVACPRTARHWVISSQTAKYHFSHGFSEHYENPYAHNLNRLKPVFEFAQTSLAATILPNAATSALIQRTRDELSAFLKQQDQPHLTTYLSVHIRRGDRKPASYNFHNNKIPIRDYSDAVLNAWGRLHPDQPEQTVPVVYLASDSLEAQRDFADTYDGDVFSLLSVEDPKLRDLASPAEYHQHTFDQLSLSARVRATRGMIVDLAMTAGFWSHGNDPLPDGVVCSISSNVCKLAAVGLGWSKAFGNVDEMGQLDNANKRWIEIDEKGQVVPIWHAFELSR